MTITLQELQQTACTIAEDASKIAMSYFRAPLEIIEKADESPVTVADRATEECIREAIAKHFPDHSIFGEEFGISGDLSGKSWVIDPIDGTRSFISGHPLFGMLMAYMEAGVPLVGLVRMPAINEIYVGAKGLGATLNGKPISTRSTVKLDKAILFINEAERLQAAEPELLARLCTAGHTRRMAYDCYPHALVASGQIDAVVDWGLEPYDYLPLVALIEAAGGVITDWDGQELTLKSDGRVVTAATKELHKELLEFIRS